MAKFACNLSIVPLRAEASHRSEIVSQLLFGETFEILEEAEDFVLIQTDRPAYTGWIQKYQYAEANAALSAGTTIVDSAGAQAISERHHIKLQHGTVIGSDVVSIGDQDYHIKGITRQANLSDFDVEFPKLTAFYLDTPYLWGGRSAQGIDCSGFSQVVYQHFGFQLKRDAYQQAEEGIVVNFQSEIKSGDLAFFDNEAGKITHVGVMIDAETIIHASGRVRIDKMDTVGIFNGEQNRYTHKLRIVKRYF